MGSAHFKKGYENHQVPAATPISPLKEKKIKQKFGYTQHNIYFILSQHCTNFKDTMGGWVIKLAFFIECTIL